MKKTLFLTCGIILVLAGTAPADWMPVGPDGGYIQSMALDPQNQDVLYAAAYDYPNSYSRVMKSTDQGGSWIEAGRVGYRYAYNMVVDPFDSSRLYVSCRTSRIYRSTDGGETWVMSTLPYVGYMVKADPFVPGRIYVGGYIRTTANRMALFVSTDHGQTWSTSVVDSFNSANCYCCAVSPTDSGTVYVAGSAGRVYRSTDGGGSWEACHGGITSSGYIYALAENPGNPDILIAGTTSYGVYQTTDHGTSWARTGFMSRAYHVDFSPASPNVGYAAYDYVYVTTDYGASWSRPIPGIKHKYVKGFAPHPDSGEVSYVCGSNGIYRTRDHGTNWEAAHTGMRIGCISTISVNPENRERVYLEVDESGIYKSSDCGANWTRCNDFLACGNIAGIGIAPGVDADVLYALEGKG